MGLPQPTLPLLFDHELTLKAPIPALHRELKSGLNVQ